MCQDPTKSPIFFLSGFFGQHIPTSVWWWRRRRSCNRRRTCPIHKQFEPKIRMGNFVFFAQPKYLLLMWLCRRKTIWKRLRIDCAEEKTIQSERMDIDDRRNAIPYHRMWVRCASSKCVHGMPSVWPGFLFLLIPIFGQFVFVEQTIFALNAHWTIIFCFKKRRIVFHSMRKRCIKCISFWHPVFIDHLLFFFVFSFHFEIIVVDVDCFSIQTINRRREEELPLTQAQQLGVNRCVRPMFMLHCVYRFVVAASAAM